MKIPGFTFSAVAAGVRYKNRLDIGMIHATDPCVTAGVFTTSQVKAAPVLIDMERVQKGGDRIQTILVNSGNANACNGDTGMEDALFTGKLAAQALGITEEQVLLSSTGVIGEKLNVSAFEKSMEELVAQLSEDKFDEVAKAIMTTDTVQKTAWREFIVGGKKITLGAMAKGSGMIMPNMATMLSFVCTDFAIAPAALQKALGAATARTFNRVTVDGDTSTNDMVLVLANGRANNPVVEELESEDGQVFARVLEDLLKELALKIVADGEGATKLITVRVEKALTAGDADTLARSVANSPLVKTAFFGEDANWGRIFMALGKAGVTFDPYKVDLFFNDVQMVKNGKGCGAEAEEKASLVLKEKEILLRVKMGQGEAAAEVYTCDFSLDYVKINADYRS